MILASPACSSTSGGGGGGQGPSSSGTSTGGSAGSAGGPSASSGGGSGAGGTGNVGGSGGAGGQTSSTGGGGSAPCLELTTGAFRRRVADGLHGVFEADVTPDQGASPTDVLALEFYGETADPSLDGDQNGTFDLSANGNTNASTCSQCVYLRVDNRIDTKVFFQSSGSIEVRDDSDTVDGAVDAKLTDVTLIEVIYGPNYVTIPVVGGACVHIASAEAVRSLIPPPSSWTCAPLYYGDGQCNCGCGVVDADCADATVQSCDLCHDTDSCGSSVCPGNIDPADNAHCD